MELFGWRVYLRIQEEQNTENHLVQLAEEAQNDSFLAKVMLRTDIVRKL